MSMHLLNAKDKKWHRVNNWWANKPLSFFDPLINFANGDLREDNWKQALWESMGDERFSTVTYTSNGQTIKESMPPEDIMGTVSEEAITDEQHELPKISGQEPSFELTKDLQSKVKRTLDLVIDGISIDHEREIIKGIEKDFNQPGTRPAVISSQTGFLFFDDMGEDATRTLSWMLSGFVNVLREHDCAILKKCRSCKRYFISTNRHDKYYCSETCRYDFHNKIKFSTPQI